MKSDNKKTAYQKRKEKLSEQDFKDWLWKKTTYQKEYNRKRILEMSPEVLEEHRKNQRDYSKRNYQRDKIKMEKKREDDKQYEADSPRLFREYIRKLLKEHEDGKELDE